MLKLSLYLLGTLFLYSFSYTTGSASEIRKTKSPHYFQDTTLTRQVLYNGKVWRNYYLHNIGDPYLLSDSFTDGSVTIGNRTFTNLKLQYDIYRDELLILNDQKIIIRENSEIIDDFILRYNNLDYHFLRVDPDSINDLSGFLNVIYKGETGVFMKYQKIIQKNAVNNMYDLFTEMQKLYVFKDGLYKRIRNRKQLIKLLGDRKEEILKYIRQNKIRITVQDPVGTGRVLSYYDSLKKTAEK